MRVRRLKPADRPAVLAIGEALPDWFTETGRRHLATDLPLQKGYVACDPQVVGFLLYVVNQGIAHIAWMGVAPGRQRQGAGRALVQRIERDMARAGVETLEVMTLGDGVEYRPYESTRAFYRALGFTTHRVETHDNPECPESLHLRKAVTPP
jgi:ribosomal protein S18 acetylase RimI-like enzyme